MTTKVDALILGAGNAGQAAATELREAGRSVVLVESRDVGGTCPLRGCVPKKVLVAAAETLDVIRRAKDQGIDVGPARLDWPTLIGRKRAIIAGTSESEAQDLERRGITIVEGAARFVDPKTVDVGGARYEADVFVVATGAKPRALDVVGHELVVTSDALLELDSLPKSIAFIGAGVVAFEFAHVFVRAGVEVTLFESGPRALAPHEKGCAERLLEASRALGIQIVTHAKTKSVTRDGDAFVVSYEHEGATKSLRVALVANGAGRVPDYAAIALDAAGVDLVDGKPKLEPNLRSVQNPRVWFAGDVRPGPQLSPLATYDGHVVGRAILGGDDRPDYRFVPSVVYTIPPLASVGLTEEQAAERGIAVEVVENDMKGWKSARSYAEDVAFAKVLIDKKSGHVVGAHILRRNADESIHAFASAMERGLTANDIRQQVFAFPTTTADTKYLVG
jgi:glutathione reductase (NADPH)